MSKDRLMVVVTTLATLSCLSTVSYGGGYITTSPWGSNVAVYTKGFESSPDYAEVYVTFWGGDAKNPKQSCSLSIIKIFHSSVEPPNAAFFTGLSSEEYYSYENDERRSVKCIPIQNTLKIQLTDGLESCVFTLLNPDNSRAMNFSGDCIGGSEGHQTYKPLDQNTEIRLMLAK